MPCSCVSVCVSGSCRVAVESISLHFHGEASHLRPLFPERLFFVKNVGRENIADIKGISALLGSKNGSAQQVKGRNRGEASLKSVLISIAGISACALGHDNVPDFDIGSNGSAGTDPNQISDIVKMDQLMGVETYGRYAHAGSHDRDFFPFVSSGVSEHIADRVKTNRIFQISLRNNLGAEGISGKKDCLGDISRNSSNMRG